MAKKAVAKKTKAKGKTVALAMSNETASWAPIAAKIAKEKKKPGKFDGTEWRMHFQSKEGGIMQEVFFEVAYIPGYDGQLSEVAQANNWSYDKTMRAIIDSAMSRPIGKWRPDWQR